MFIKIVGKPFYLCIIMYYIYNGNITLHLTKWGDREVSQWSDIGS